MVHVHLVHTKIQPIPIDVEIKEHSEAYFVQRCYIAELVLWVGLISVVGEAHLCYGYC